MDRTNKKLLDGNYKSARATNFQKQYDKKMTELSTSGRRYTQDQLHALSHKHAQDHLTNIDPQLQGKIYADFGGSKEAAQKQYKAWQRKEVERKLAERKKRQEKKQKQDQPKQQKAESARVTRDALKEMQQRKNVRGRFNNNGQNI